MVNFILQKLKIHFQINYLSMFTTPSGKLYGKFHLTRNIYLNKVPLMIPPKDETVCKGA